LRHEFMSAVQNSVDATSLAEIEEWSKLKLSRSWGRGKVSEESGDNEGRKEGEVEEATSERQLEEDNWNRHVIGYTGR